MTRRDFALALVALTAYLGSLGLAKPGNAQQPSSVRRIGVLLVSIAPDGKEARALRQGLWDAGYSEGRNIVIDWRYTDGEPKQLAALANELVQRKVEVIVTTSTTAAQAAKNATSQIPIVIALSGDPVGSGLVANLAHPGGNVTGLTIMTTDLTAKRLQLLKETIPRLGRVTVLWNPATPWHQKAIADLKAAAPVLSLELNFVSVRTAAELADVISAASKGQAQALYLMGSTLFFSHPKMLATLALKARLPAIYEERKFADQGGLMSYGASYTDLFHRSARYVDRILKGAEPRDLPMEQPTKFELVVNVRTAKALRITIPESVLLRADEVIR